MNVEPPLRRTNLAALGGIGFEASSGRKGDWKSPAAFGGFEAEGVLIKPRMAMRPRVRPLPRRIHVRRETLELAGRVEVAGEPIDGPEPEMSKSFAIGGSFARRMSEGDAEVIGRSLVVAARDADGVCMESWTDEEEAAGEVRVRLEGLSGVIRLAASAGTRPSTKARG